MKFYSSKMNKNLPGIARPWEFDFLVRRTSQTIDSSPTTIKSPVESCSIDIFLSQYAQKLECGVIVGYCRRQLNLYFQVGAV